MWIILSSPLNIQDLKNSKGEALENWLRASRELTWKHFPKQIHFYAPSFAPYNSSHFQPQPDSFPSISITGTSCALNCGHCQGRVLKGMIPATTPGKLIKVCEQIKDRGAVGCLISGGSLSDGSVPLRRFVDSLIKIRRLGLKVIVHTGLIDLEFAKALKSAGVEAALIDVIGSNETIKRVYNLDATVEDFERSLNALHRSSLPTVPHVLVGLHYGDIRGEYSAITMISKYTPSALVIIALTSIKGTLMERTSPPEPEDVSKIIVAARYELPSTPIALGCMRPLGEHRVRTDTLALRAGVNAIAFPTQDVIESASVMNIKPVFHSVCCSQIYEDLGSNHQSLRNKLG